MRSAPPEGRPSEHADGLARSCCYGATTGFRHRPRLRRVMIIRSEKRRVGQTGAAARTCIPCELQRSQVSSHQPTLGRSGSCRRSTESAASAHAQAITIEEGTPSKETPARKRPTPETLTRPWRECAQPSRPPGASEPRSTLEYPASPNARPCQALGVLLRIAPVRTRPYKDFVLP